MNIDILYSSCEFFINSNKVQTLSLSEKKLIASALRFKRKKASKPVRFSRVSYELSAKGRKASIVFVQNAKNTRYSFFLLTKAQDMVYNRCKHKNHIHTAKQKRGEGGRWRKPIFPRLV